MMTAGPMLPPPLLPSLPHVLIAIESPGHSSSARGTSSKIASRTGIGVAADLGHWSRPPHASFRVKVAGYAVSLILLTLHRQSEGPRGPEVEYAKVERHKLLELETFLCELNTETTSSKATRTTTTTSYDNNNVDRNLLFDSRYVSNEGLKEQFTMSS